MQPVTDACKPNGSLSDEDLRQAGYGELYSRNEEAIWWLEG